MIKWTKPSGMEVETNDFAATIAHCERIGWERHTETLTVELVGDMTKKQLKVLIGKYELDVDDSVAVADLRVAVIDAMFEPES